MNAPVERYLARVSNGLISNVLVIRETSRSWITGTERSPFKYAKKDYRETTESAYKQQVWVKQHAKAIAKSVDRWPPLSYTALKKIADILGYTPKGDS